MLCRQDLHIHTHFSRCAKPTATVEHYYWIAPKLGLDTICFTDHMWDAPNPVKKFYVEQPYSHILGLKDEMASVPVPEGLRVLFGAEGEYDTAERRPAISVETAQQLDVLLIPNSHTHLTMPKEYYPDHRKHIDFMRQAFFDICASDVAPYVTAIPHPFGAVCCPYNKYDLMAEMRDEDFTECFEAAKEKNIALEINVGECLPATSLDSEIVNTQTFRQILLGKKVGCKFTFGSDSHHDAGHVKFQVLERYARLAGLTEDDILYV